MLVERLETRTNCSNVSKQRYELYIYYIYICWFCVMSRIQEKKNVDEGEKEEEDFFITLQVDNTISIVIEHAHHLFNCGSSICVYYILGFCKTKKVIRIELLPASASKFSPAADNALLSSSQSMDPEPS